MGVKNFHERGHFAVVQETKPLNAVLFNKIVLLQVNHRKILDGMFEVCGVPAEKFRTISSAVDKLDKVCPTLEVWLAIIVAGLVCLQFSSIIISCQTPWQDVRSEMVDEKGLDPSVADAIGEYVHNHGGIDVLEKMEADEKLGNNKSGKAGIDDMKLLLRYCELFGVLDKVKYCRVFS